MKFLKHFYYKFNELTKLHYIKGSFNSFNFARFLLSKSDYSVDKKIVRPRAFMPHNLEVSIFDITGLSATSISNNLKIKFERVRKKNVKKYAEIKGKDIILEDDLSIKYNNIPKRHANIVGWSEIKEIQKDHALYLASKSNLRDFI